VSPRALRNTVTWKRRLPSSTCTLAHTCFMSSRLSTTSPGRAARNISMSRARPPMCRAAPSFSNKRAFGVSRKGPKAIGRSWDWSSATSWRPPARAANLTERRRRCTAPEREIPAGAASAQGLPPRRSNRAALFQTAVSLRIRRPRSCRIRSDCRRHCRIAGGGASRRSDAVALGRTLLHMFRGFSLVRARSRAWF
jgi:hypothetical protein